MRVERGELSPNNSGAFDFNVRLCSNKKAGVVDLLSAIIHQKH